MEDNSKSKELEESIAKLFNGKTTMERAVAANHLGYLKDKRAIQSLVEALPKEKDKVVMNRIIEAFGEIKDNQATPVIIELLKKELQLPELEQDKQRIFLIVESLMKIGDKRALKDLGILLESCDNEIRNLTVEALTCIDPDWKQNIKNL